jgi:hypothetical protein
MMLSPSLMRERPARMVATDGGCSKRTCTSVPPVKSMS